MQLSTPGPDDSTCNDFANEVTRISHHSDQNNPLTLNSKPIRWVGLHRHSTKWTHENDPGQEDDYSILPNQIWPNFHTLFLISNVVRLVLASKLCWVMSAEYISLGLGWTFAKVPGSNLLELTNKQTRPLQFLDLKNCILYEKKVMHTFTFHKRNIALPFIFTIFTRQSALIPKKNFAWRPIWSFSLPWQAATFLGCSAIFELNFADKSPFRILLKKRPRPHNLTPIFGTYHTH